MSVDETWNPLTDALDFALGCVRAEEPLNDRERADGDAFVAYALSAVLESALLLFDPARPAFMSMLDPVRHVGGAGPDIDYDVAIIATGVPHRVVGVRGGATYVGITVYGHAGAEGASAIVASVDVDDIVASDGSFSYEFDDPAASRVIVRQYFHDRDTQAPGSWSIERVAAAEPGGDSPLPTAAGMAFRLENAAQSLRWNAQLNRLWTPERRQTPNEFMAQTAHEVVAAVPNPDVNYSFSWWALAADEALVIRVVPPACRYWALQICDRWFQCFPQRRTNLNDRQVTLDTDGSARVVLAHSDPGVPNWVETGGHQTGVMFFRWLHAQPEHLPVCDVVPVDSLT